MPPPLPAVIAACGLTKRYGPLTAVDAISFEVGEGECVGLLGPNGAGKTTTIRMLTAFTPITAGTASIFGLDIARHPRAVKAQMGICPQEDNPDPDFPVRKNLLIYARYHGIPAAEARRRADELLAFVQLGEKAGARIQELSGGMKRRLMLARALLNEPRLLVLDEPTTGLDPQARHLIWQRVRQLKERRVTVLLTTHYMEEASQLCDRVILMHEGRILLDGTPAALVRSEVGEQVVELWDVEPGLLAFLDRAGWPRDGVEDRLYLYDVDGGRIAHEIEQHFPHQPRLIRPASLEDVFLRRAGRALRD